MYKLFVLAAVLAVAFAAPKSAIKLPRLDGKIVGGSATTIDKYPYQISLLYRGSHICGGSIINQNYVVTAAHCTDGSSASQLSIRAGSSIRNSGGVVIQVSKISQNPGFTQSNLDYDVSVLKLASPLTLGTNIKAITLQTTEPASGLNAVITGWGALTEGGSSPSQLQTVTVQTVSRATCKNAYGSSAISNNMICASASGKDSCQGDSGGPLAVNGVLAGIVSWGYGCARPGYPGVYSNVASLRSYIINNSS